MLGGSTTFGSGASSDTTTIPALLERELGRRGHAAEVINGGVGGFVAWQELVYLTTDLLDLDPDIVVFYHGANDAVYALAGLVRFPGMSTEIEYLISQPFSAALLAWFDSIQLVRIPMNFVKSWQLRSVTTAYASREVFTGRAREEPPARENPPSAERKEADALVFMDRARALGRASGFSVLFVLQPTLEDLRHGKPLSDMERRIEERFTDPAVRASVTRIYDGFRRVYTCENALDLSRLFGGVTTTLYCDTVHLNDKGNRIVAAAIAARLAGDLAIE